MSNGAAACRKAVESPAIGNLGFQRYIALDAPVFVLGEVRRLPGEGADRRVWAMRGAKGWPFIVSALAPEDYVAYQRAGARHGLMAGGAAAVFGAALIGWILLD